MERNRVTQMDLVSFGGQPAGVCSRATSNIRDHGWQRREVSLHQLLHPRELNPSEALKETSGFLAGVIKLGDFFGDRHLAYFSSPTMY
jgi:hypothetical protein